MSVIILLAVTSFILSPLSKMHAGYLTSKPRGVLRNEGNSEKGERKYGTV